MQQGSRVWLPVFCGYWLCFFVLVLVFIAVVVVFVVFVFVVVVVVVVGCWLLFLLWRVSSVSFKAPWRPS